MKILHVVNSLEPGGMENGLVNVARALDPEQFEIHVACLERRGAFAARLPNPQNVIVLGKQSGFSWRATLQLRREIARLRPALIHSHNLGPLIYSSLATLGGLQCPIIQGEHAELTAEECAPKRFLQRRMLYRCCRKIHAVGHAAGRQLIELGFPVGKITTIVNGVDTLRFLPGDRSKARQETGIPEEALVLGVVGRFGRFKRHALLLEAFERVAAAHTRLHLLVVGSGGPEEKSVSEQARLHPFANRIHLVGFQENPVPYYQTLDLLAVPSVNEGLSNAVLEAMACGVPVLASSACGNRDVITDGEDGFVADLFTAENLGGQLDRLLATPLLLKAAGENARKKILESFSIDRMVSGYADLYREVADGESRGG